MRKTNETRRWLSVGIMAACYLADVCLRPWAIGSISREYRRDAGELIARYAREDSAR